MRINLGNLKYHLKRIKKKKTKNLKYRINNNLKNFNVDNILKAKKKGKNN